MMLIIRDDGVGFDVEKRDKANHFGLEGMRERVQLVGGEFVIISKPGEGTTVELVI